MNRWVYFLTLNVFLWGFQISTTFASIPFHISHNFVQKDAIWHLKDEASDALDLSQLKRPLEEIYQWFTKNKAIIDPAVFQNIKKITLEDNDLEEIPNDLLALFPNLESVNLEKNPLTSFDFSEGLHETLKELSLGADKSVTAVPPLNKFKYLEKFTMTNGQINNIQALRDITGICELNLAGNKLKKFSSADLLKSKDTLERVIIWENSATEVDLKKFPKLHYAAIDRENPNLRDLVDVVPPSFYNHTDPYLFLGARNNANRFLLDRDIFRYLKAPNDPYLRKSSLIIYTNTRVTSGIEELDHLFSATHFLYNRPRPKGMSLLSDETKPHRIFDLLTTGGMKALDPKHRYGFREKGPSASHAEKRTLIASWVNLALESKNQEDYQTGLQELIARETRPAVLQHLQLCEEIYTNARNIVKKLTPIPEKQRTKAYLSLEKTLTWSSSAVKEYMNDLYDDSELSESLIHKKPSFVEFVGGTEIFIWKSN